MSAQPRFTELDAAVEQLVIAEKRARDAERKAHRLERQMARVEQDDPVAGEILDLLDLWWREVKDSNLNVAHGLDSTRASKVRSAIKRRKKMARDEGLEESYGLLMCRKAIIGITCDDWAMGRNPKTGGKCFNDIAEHILNTDNDIEKWAAMFDQWCSHLTMKRLPKDEARKLQQSEVKRARTEQKWQAVHQRWRRENPEEAVLDALSAGGWQWRCTGTGWRSQCPAHEGDNSNSLSIAWNGAGDKLLLQCMAHHCEVPYIMAALGLPLYALFKHEKAA